MPTLDPSLPAAPSAAQLALNQAADDLRESALAALAGAHDSLATCDELTAFFDQPSPADRPPTAFLLRGTARRPTPGS